MKTTVEKKVNIAPSSTHGHFIEGANQVVNLDLVNETFLVKGESELTTNNHTTIKLKEDCLITCQTVYDPFTGAFNKSRD